MRILWLTENYPPNRGGMAESCDRIVGGLRQRDIVIDVLHFSNRRKPFVTEVNVKGSYTVVPKYQDMPHALNLALSFVEHHLMVNDYDLILAFGGLFPLTAVPIFSQLFALPSYVCLRGNDFDLSVFNPKRREMLADAIRCSSAVLVVSDNKASRVRRLFPDAKVFYTPNGIDAEQWFPLRSEVNFAASWRRDNVADNKTVIGIFGHLKDKKGLSFFIEALRRTSLQDKVHLVLSGEQDDTVLDALMGDSLRDDVVPHTILPFMDRVDLPKHYLSCDWIAIPSFYEGMPNVMLEAGALGVPVLASGVDGMKDVLINGETGLLFKPLDLGDCSAVIDRAHRMDHQMRRSIGVALKNYVESQLGVDHEIMRYIEIFDKG